MCVHRVSKQSQSTSWFRVAGFGLRTLSVHFPVNAAGFFLEKLVFRNCGLIFVSPDQHEFPKTQRVVQVIQLKRWTSGIFGKIFRKKMMRLRDPSFADKRLYVSIALVEWNNSSLPFNLKCLELSGCPSCLFGQVSVCKANWRQYGVVFERRREIWECFDVLVLSLILSTLRPCCLKSNLFEIQYTFFRLKRYKCEYHLSVAQGRCFCCC